MKKYIKELRKIITKDYGKKCKDFCFDCIVCRVHRVLDDLQSIADFNDILDGKKKDKHKK